MHSFRLTKQFLREFPMEEISPATIFYDLATGVMEGEFEESAREETDAVKAAIAREREEIAALAGADEAFRMLRRQTNAVNRVALYCKALEFEAELMPRVVERLFRSDYEIYIENAARMLAISEADYTPALIARYDEIRSPHALSLICVVVGMRGGEEVVPWMLERFVEMVDQMPLSDEDDNFSPFEAENHEQGPLFALNLLYDRFYRK